MRNIFYEYLKFLYKIVWMAIILVCFTLTVLGPIGIAAYGIFTGDHIIGAAGAVLCFFIPVGMAFCKFIYDAIL